MDGSDKMKKGQFQGELFELLILKLLKMSDYEVVDVSKHKDRIRQKRKNFIEIKGRGAWHQIDAPCDYKDKIPFIYPLRLLGEVKFFSKTASSSGFATKEHIRELIGILKDISENYTVSSKLTKEMIENRRTEIGVFFSANGFNEEAEKLAYAHDVRTISYENNEMVRAYKDIIEHICNLEFASRADISTRRVNHIKKRFNDCIVSSSHLSSNGHYPYHAIKDSFIASTKTGYLFHFLGNNEFPNALFQAKDAIECKIFYDESENGERFFYLTMNGENNNKYYFSAPKFLSEKSLFGNDMLDIKSDVFAELYFNKKINNLKRSLVLKIDTEWLKSIRR